MEPPKAGAGSIPSSSGVIDRHFPHKGDSRGNHRPDMLIRHAPPTLPDLNQPILEGDPNDEADSTLVDQPLDLRNEKDPRVIYFLLYQKKVRESFQRRGELADLIKPTIERAESPFPAARNRFTPNDLINQVVAELGNEQAKKGNGPAPTLPEVKSLKRWFGLACKSVKSGTGLDIDGKVYNLIKALNDEQEMEGAPR